MLLNDSEWTVQYKADHRLGAIALHIKHGDDIAPPTQINLADVLRGMPVSELRFLVSQAKSPKPWYSSIDDVREQVIRDTDCNGKVVLDIGGYDGWAAKQCLDQGAKRAICLDNHQYDHYGWEEKKHPGVEYVQGDFMDFTQAPEYPMFVIYSNKKSLPTPDAIIFFDVLYHLKNPWAGLDKLRQIIKPDGILLLSSLYFLNEEPWIRLYEPREYNGTDETVYLVPSPTALERLLNLTGWEHTQMGIYYDRVVYRCTPTPKWERKHQDS